MWKRGKEAGREVLRREEKEIHVEMYEKDEQVTILEWFSKNAGCLTLAEGRDTVSAPNLW